MVGHPEEDVQVLFTVAELHFLRVRRAKVIESRLEGVPHHAVALRTPIERSGRSDTTVHPVVGIFDGDALSAVREATVLHATAIKVFSRAAGQFEVCAIIIKGARRRRDDHGMNLIQLVDGETAGLAIEHHLDFVCRERAAFLILLQFKFLYRLTRLFDENVGSRFGFRIVGSASGGILVEAEQIVAVEVDRDFSLLSIDQFNGVRVNFSRFLNDRSVVAGGRIKLCSLFLRSDAEGSRFQATGQANK